MLALGEQIHSSKLITIFFFIKKKKSYSFAAKLLLPLHWEKSVAILGTRKNFPWEYFNTFGRNILKGYILKDIFGLESIF